MWSRGREDRRSRDRATDSQRHGRGAEDEWRGTEAVRRGRDAPTPTRCIQSHPERQQWHRCHRGGQRHPPPPGTLSRPPQGRRGRHTLPEVVRGYPLNLTSSQPRQTRHRPRQAARGAEHPPIAHRAHRGRADAPQSAERGEWHSYPPTAPRRATAAQDDPQMVRPYLYEYV